MSLNPVDPIESFWSDLNSEDFDVKEFDYLLPVSGSLDDIAASPYHQEQEEISERLSPKTEEKETKVKVKEKSKKNKDNDVKPDKRPKWSSEEDEIIVNLYLENGGNWKLISNHLPGRPANLIKNRFYGTLKKKLTEDQNRTITTNKLKKEDYFLKEHKIELFEKWILSNESGSPDESDKAFQAMNLTQCVRNQLTCDEKRSKVKELYGKLAAIQAFLTKTEKEIGVFK